MAAADTGAGAHRSACGWAASCVIRALARAAPELASAGCDDLARRTAVYSWVWPLADPPHSMNDSDIPRARRARSATAARSIRQRHAARLCARAARGCTRGGRARAIRPRAQGERRRAGARRIRAAACAAATHHRRRASRSNSRWCRAARSAEVISIARPAAAPDKTRFMHIAGMEDLKKSIRLQIIEPFINPGLFAKFRKKAGGGILLYGPPGCGKTMLARAVANECNASFIIDRHRRDPLDVAGRERAQPRAHVREGARAEAVRDVLRRARCAGLRALEGELRREPQDRQRIPVAARRLRQCRTTRC